MDEQNQIVLENKTVSMEDKLGAIVLGVLGFVLPLFFIPSIVVPLESSKIFIISVGVIFAFLLFVISTVKKGRFEFPGHKMFLFALSVPVVLFLASLFGNNPQMSLFGYNLETDTFGFVLLGFLSLFLIPNFLRSKGKVFNSYVGFIIGLVLIGLFSATKFVFGGDSLVLKIFPGASSNPIGAWTDLAVYFGLGIILILVTIEMLLLKKLHKAVLYVALLLSLFALMVLGFYIIWIILAIFTLIFFVYNMSIGGLKISPSGVHKVSYISVILLVIAVIFIFNPGMGSGGKLSEVISNKFNVSNVEIRPTLTSTIEVAKPVLKENLLLGSGPNTFGANWIMYKPVGINSTNFWGVIFPYGFSYFFTFIATSGILGFLSWILFLASFIWLGVRSLFTSSVDTQAKFLLVSSFLASLYLWVMIALYAPSSTILFMAFFFTGLFVSMTLNEGIMRRESISFVGNIKLSFFAVLLLIMLFIGGLAFGYTGAQRTLSGVYFQKALIEGNQNQNIDQAEMYLKRAIALAPQDLYHRTLSGLYVVRMRQVLDETAPGTNEEKRAVFEKALADSLNSAQLAVGVDSTNYQNWTNKGGIYEALVPEPLSVKGAYENAKISYEEAMKYNPHSPEMPLLLARLEMANKNNVSARELINQSLGQKNDYVDAYFLLAQIEVSEKNLPQAIRAAETVALLSPNNAGVFFQLGLLKYNNDDYVGASEAFSKALSIVPAYANAKYFLGLSMYKLKKNDLAIQEFRDLEKTNPDNKEISAILKNLEDNKDPFFGISPPANQEPEKATTPPIIN